MPFNKDFSKKLDMALIDAYKLTGCFNWHCRAPNPSKRCSKCGVAVYCSKACQKADWNDPDDPHKHLCQVYNNNTNPKDWKGVKNQQFPIPVGLAAINLMLKDDLWSSMRTRADLFLEEVKRVVSTGRELHRSIGLVVNVMYNFDFPILQGFVTFLDPTVPTVLPNGMIDPDGTHECVYYVLFTPIGEGGEDVRRRLHPSYGGSGEISSTMRKRVIKELKEFFHKVTEYGLHIHLITYSRGLMWMGDDDFRGGAAKELEKANGGNRIAWEPNLRVAMEDSHIAASKAAFGG